MQDAIKKATEKVEENKNYNKVALQSGGEYSSNGNVKVLYLTIHYDESANIDQEELKQLGKEAFITVNEIISNENRYDKFEVSFQKETGSGVAKETITRTFDYQLVDLQ